MDIDNNNPTNQVVRLPANPFTRESANAYKRKAVEVLMGLNPKTWQDLESKGVIPHPDATYAECVQAIFKHYQKGNDAKLLRIEGRNEGKPAFETRSGLSPLQEAEIIKKIKLNMAREEQIHISNAKDRGLLLDKQELLELLGPVLGNIASVLRNAADSEPLLQPVVDKCFESLFKAGKILAEQCEVDSGRYVKERMAEEVDLEAILNSAELEIY